MIAKHLKTYLETFVTKNYNRWGKKKEDEFNVIMGFLEDYTPRNNKYIEAKKKLWNNAKKFEEGREKITEGFKNGIFPFYYDEAYEERTRFEREQEKKEEEGISNIRNKNGLIDYEKLMRKIGFKEKNLNSELVKKYFFTYDLGDVLKNFKKSKINSERNEIQIRTIKNGLRDLKEEITNMSEEEKKSKNQMK